MAALFSRLAIRYLFHEARLSAGTKLKSFVAKSTSVIVKANVFLIQAESLLLNVTPQSRYWHIEFNPALDYPSGNVIVRYVEIVAHHDSARS